MKLTIIIPVYKTEKTLDRCVESILSQDYSDYEIILVDDGSPDLCPEKCDAWTEHDSRIRVIHKANGGLSDARNAGIEVARGDYLTFVDSDDMIAPSTLAPLMNKIAHDESIQILEYPVSIKGKNMFIPHNMHYDDIQQYWVVTKAYTHTYVWNKIFRKELFADIRFPVGRVFEDAWIYPLLLQKARSVTTTDKGCYVYTDNLQGITAKADADDLIMLLESNIDRGMTVDDAYYLYILNIQLDVYRLSGKILLQERKDIRTSNLRSLSDKIKIITLKIFGIKGLCRIHKTLRHLL